MNELEQQAEQINAYADMLMKKKQFVEAMVYYRQSVELMQQAGNIKRAEEFQKELDIAIGNRATELNNQGDMFFKQKKFKSAMEIYEIAWNLLQKAGPKWVNKFGEEFTRELQNAKSHYALETLLPSILALADAKRFEEAIEQLKELLIFIPQDKDSKTHQIIKDAMEKIIELWADLLNREGDGFNKIKNFGEAIQMYVQAVNLINQTQNHYKIAQFREKLKKTFENNSKVIRTQGDKLLKEGKNQEAAHLYKQSLEMAKDAGLADLVKEFQKQLDIAYERFAQQINNMGDQLFKQWKYDEAAKIYKNSIEIAKLANRPKLVEEFTREYNDSINKWVEKKIREAHEAEYKESWSNAIALYQEAEDIGSKSYDSKYRKECQENIDKLLISLAGMIKVKAGYAVDAKKYKEAYELFDLCVVCCDIAHNDHQMKLYRKLRDEMMGKIPK